MARLHLLTTALLLALLLAPLAAHANPQAEAQVENLIEEAYDDYDFLELDGALEKLGQARTIAERNRLSSDFLLEIHLLTGIVAGAGGDESTAIEAFRRALAVDSAAVIHPFYITPTLEELFDEARRQGPWQDRPTPAPTPTPAPAPTPAPPASIDISHSSPPGARAGQPLELTARIPVEAPTGRVVISYRVFGESGFRQADMEVAGDGTTWRGVIPGQNIQRVQVDYYIQAFDRTGRAIAQTAGPSRPLSVPIMGASERPEDVVRDRDRDRDRRTDRSPRDADDLSDQVFSFALGLGTGVGLATGDPAVYGEEVDLNAGMAPTPLHIYSEFGISPRGSSFHAVPFLRLQLVFLESGMDLEPLVGFKGRFFVVDSMPARVFAEGGFGYGNVSHLVTLNLPGGTVNDTTREGPFHIGGGAGITVMLSESFGIHNNLYTMLMFDQFSLQIDFSSALYFAF